MGTRDGAIARARSFFDNGGFAERLATLVAIPSTSQDPGHEADVRRYLEIGIRHWLDRMGFSVAIHDNPEPGFGPILTAERREGADLPTVLTYGHGDTVRGLDDQWSEGRTPWAIRDEGDRWYGRGTADNKGQHVLNLSALEAVLAERGGRLGANIKLVLETSEERGSLGLRDFVAAQRDALAADLLLASDGPRVDRAVPTLSCGTRGSYNFDLSVSLRPGGVHSGNWGGLIADPAIILAHAIASIADRHGRILLRDWVPPSGIPDAVRAALAGCAPGSEGDVATIDPAWGEPGLSAAERVYAWTSFIVLAMLAGRPENPVNAVAPSARATCQLRYTVDVDPETFMPALRRHLDAAGFPEVQIGATIARMAASRTDPANPWVRWAAASMERTLGARVQVIPNAGGGLPGDVFVDHLGVPLVWVPHSYNGCQQHGPNEHLLKAPAREGIAAFAGLWWDLGEGAPT
ncbi:MAG TPA: M20/M25/M40 family metallo-hydrolase [Acetobacteraceae bacterium]|nr:M20/M25/M40 family metallo-hydrolase [Acetobacteraceae bacterium]